MKAIVIKINNKDATLLQDNGQFIMTRNRDFNIGDIITMNRKSFQRRILALAATAAMLVLILAAGVLAYATPVYFVSLDVNPSFVMEVNLFERLISMKAMNEDAEAILADLEWKNKDVNEVLAITVQMIEQEGYFGDGGGILIAAAGKGNARTSELLTGLKARIEALDLEDVSVQTEAFGVEMVKSAKEFGLTPGKYNLITKLLGEAVTSENAEESVKDLMARFTANKDVTGKETAESARQNNEDGSLPSEAAAGQQQASEASQNASEATQIVSEMTQNNPETLPSGEVTAGTETEMPDVPVDPQQPTMPTTDSRRP